MKVCARNGADIKFPGKIMKFWGSRQDGIRARTALNLSCQLPQNFSLN